MIWQFLKVKTECGENIALVSVKIKVIFLISKQCAQTLFLATTSLSHLLRVTVTVFQLIYSYQLWILE